MLNVTKDTLGLARQVIGTAPLVMKVVNMELRHAMPLHDFSQVGLMRVLARKGPCTVSVLADLWSVSAPTMSRSIRRLEERGWVELTRTPEDRRQVVVTLSETGQQMLAESYDTMTRSVDKLLSTLSDEDLVRLAAGLDVLGRLFGEAAHPPQALDETGAIGRGVNNACADEPPRDTR